MAITQYENRDGAAKRTRVRVLKSLPGHPAGCIRTPHHAVLKQWIRIGIAEVVEETTHASTLSLPAKQTSKKRRTRGD